MTQADDERAIRAVIAKLEAAWNASDSGAFTAPMVETVDFISVLGDRYNGREIVERGHRHIFDTIYKDSRVAYTIETYPGGHGFAVPDNVGRYDEALAERHWAALETLYGSTLRSLSG